MGLGDRFKDMKKQAQGAVAENKEKIQEAVEVASLAADRKTRGKHTARIAKFGQKANDAVDKIAREESNGDVDSTAADRAGNATSPGPAPPPAG
jgi:hypothetical protein